MTWLLFLDESGHDHHHAPYEVRGGVAVPTARLWEFTRRVHEAELLWFGVRLADVGIEFKGAKLLEKQRFKWSMQSPQLEPADRQSLCRSFLERTRRHESPRRAEFSAYGQASVGFVEAIMQILLDVGAKLFAGVVPGREQGCASLTATADYLRKDQVFLLERYYYFLEQQRSHGLLVLDRVDLSEDRAYLNRMQKYFTKTRNGRQRTQWIVPTPMFVDSSLSPGVQAADICIYCVNWGFRIPGKMLAPVRDEIAAFSPWLKRLQFEGDGYQSGNGELKTFRSFGIFYVPDLYESRA